MMRIADDSLGMGKRRGSVCDLLVGLNITMP